MLAEGTIVGTYRVLRKLGEGGMGAVFAGEHTLLGRRAAIKMLLPSLSANQEIVQRFFNEARAVTQIADPGIVQVFDFGFHVDGSAFIVMELLDGEPMDHRLHRIGRFAPGDALRLMRLICTSLGAAHAKGIVHRDLKPENIYIVADPAVPGGERAKLLDFGIAKLTGEDPGKMKTRTGMMMGTPLYMSPEQCHGASLVDARSDIYSMGCVLMAMLTGRPPFDGSGSGELIAAHLREPPPYAAARLPGLPPVFDQILQRCLAKSPAERFQTMAEMVQALGQAEQLVAPGSGMASPALYLPTVRLPTPPPAMSTPPPGMWSQPGLPPARTTLAGATGQMAIPAPRRLGLIAGVAVAGVAVAVLISVLVTRPRATDGPATAAHPTDTTAAARPTDTTAAAHPTNTTAAAHPTDTAAGTAAVRAPDTHPEDTSAGAATVRAPDTAATRPSSSAAEAATVRMPDAATAVRPSDSDAGAAARSSSAATGTATIRTSDTPAGGRAPDSAAGIHSPNTAAATAGPHTALRSKATGKADAEAAPAATAIGAGATRPPRTSRPPKIDRKHTEGSHARQDGSDSATAFDRGD